MTKSAVPDQMVEETRGGASGKEELRNEEFQSCAVGHLRILPFPLSGLLIGLPSVTFTEEKRCNQSLGWDQGF